MCCNTDKVDNPNKHILTFILQDYNSPHNISLRKVNLKSLLIRCLQNFIITLNKGLFFANYPGYLKDMFPIWSSSYNLKSNCILALSNPRNPLIMTLLHSLLVDTIPHRVLVKIICPMNINPLLSHLQVNSERLKA